MKLLISGTLILAAGVLLGFLLAQSTRGAEASRPAHLVFVPLGQPSETERDGRTGAPSASAPLPAVVTPSAETAHPGLAGASVQALRGTASWGDGWTGIVTRWPRGTWVCISGAVGKACGRSVGYGPAAWTHRLVDLDRATFRAVCGPLSQGFCTVTVMR